ncbi:hypothetical protein [Desulfocastanea catecholica]
MEPSIVFAEFIIGVGALHLVGRTSEQVAKWWTKGRSDRGQVSRNSTKKVVRGDWYVFFSCADLLGKTAEKKHEQSKEIAEKKRPRRDPRPVVRV